MADDPRTDRHPETGAGPKSYPTPKGTPEPGPGGLGTGTKDAPEHDPAAQPGSQK